MIDLVLLLPNRIDKYHFYGSVSMKKNLMTDFYIKSKSIYDSCDLWNGIEGLRSGCRFYVPQINKHFWRKNGYFHQFRLTKMKLFLQEGRVDTHGSPTDCYFTIPLNIFNSYFSCVIINLFVDLAGRLMILNRATYSWEKNKYLLKKTKSISTIFLVSQTMKINIRF